MKKEGLEPDESCWTAFANGKRARSASARSNVLQRGYEHLLHLECAPEAAAKTAPALGRIKTIRIQW